MVEYDSAAIYIDSCTTVEGRIAACEAVITSLFTAAAKAAAGEFIGQYEVNDSHVIIKASYKSAADVMRSITAFTTLKNMYVNQLNGHVFRAVDGKNLI